MNSARLHVILRICFALRKDIEIRTTCIKAQKWPPTKPTHIVMNNSCVVTLTENGMEIGDGHYIGGQNGVKGYDP